MKRYTKFLLVLLAMFIVLGNAATFDLSGGLLNKGLPFKITDFLFSIIILKNLVLIFRKKLFFDSFLFWILWGIFSIFLNIYFYDYQIEEIKYGILYPIRMMIYIFSVKCIVNELYKVFEFKEMMNKIRNYYTLACLIGFFQYIFYPIAFDFYNFLKMFNVYILNPDPHQNRLFGTYLDPNFFGSILIIPIGLTLAELFSKKSKKIKIFIQLIFQIIILILTVSRSGLLGLVILFTVFFIFEIKMKIKKNVLGFVIFLSINTAVILILFHNKIRILKRIFYYKMDPSAQARFSNFSETLIQIKENFFTGIGYNMLGFYKGNSGLATAFGADSSWLFIFVTTGIIGMIILVLYFAKNIYIVYKLRNKENYYYANAIIGITISSFVITNFNNLLLYPLWIVIYIYIHEFYFKIYKRERTERKYESNNNNS